MSYTGFSEDDNEYMASEPIKTLILDAVLKNKKHFMQNTQTNHMHLILSFQNRINKLEAKSNLAIDGLNKISALETGGTKSEVVREAKITLTKIGRL